MASLDQPVVHLDVQDNGVAVVRIHRPEVKNALNAQVREELAEHFRTLAKRRDVRAIVLTGGDQFFVAGADIKEFASASPIEMYRRHTEYLWEAISRCPKPVIAAVNGFALGGGCELAMHCDLIVAGESARFAQPEVKLGLMPGAGGTQRLVRAVGKFQAMRIALTGCMVKAPEALAMGMLSEVVADDQTIPRALELAAHIAALPPLAVEQIKEVMLAGADLPLESALVLERKAFQLLFDSADQKEGAAAFFEKRTANYLGE
ncbi:MULTISPECIES: enoyl-CoA hydratase [unclassified Pseudomonas]|uniref:enoyl-CoA hydratase n=1 Tax=unclassified Pseudomonas TaxID=196821 RepID=UPI0015A1BFD7|nr:MULTISPECIES: enoyl-CoA hydratase [unclassified Pseudomonas]NWC96824.1 enoyl-CoA hydratase/isomerase family protein [Pseudomonas sp. IPO3779]NWD21193.1 enoyl-CoA hydratase/isomerase family protein [Pseudomonas sp. IPO3778]